MGHHKTLFSLVSFIILSPLTHLWYSLIKARSRIFHAHKILNWWRAIQYKGNFFSVIYRGFGNISYIHAGMGSQVPLKEFYRTANCIISHTARRHRDIGNFTKHLETNFCRKPHGEWHWLDGWSIVVYYCVCWQCLNLLSVCRGKIMFNRSSVYAMSQPY